VALDRLPVGVAAPDRALREDACDGFDVAAGPAALPAVINDGKSCTEKNSGARWMPVCGRDGPFSLIEETSREGAGERSRSWRGDDARDRCGDGARDGTRDGTRESGFKGPWVASARLAGVDTAGSTRLELPPDPAKNGPNRGAFLSSLTSVAAVAMYSYLRGAWPLRGGGGREMDA